MVKKRRGKYNVSKPEDRTYKGKTYMSKLEMEYRKYLDKQKNIVSIDEQVPFQITVNGKKICKYVLDFEIKYKDGSIEFVDVKGIKGGTDVFRIKKKLVEALFEIKILEVYREDFIV